MLFWKMNQQKNALENQFQRHKELSLHLKCSLWPFIYWGSSMPLCALPSKNNYCYARNCAEPQEYKNQPETIPTFKEFTPLWRKKTIDIFFLFFYFIVARTQHRIHPPNKNLSVRYSIVNYWYNIGSRSLDLFILYKWNSVPFYWYLFLFPSTSPQLSLYDSLLLWFWLF